MKKNTAFFVNGGAGRMLSSIPALELYQKENPKDDFIIVCEGGWNMFKGHPTLGRLCVTTDTPNVFIEKIKDRQCVSLEPYRVWEYYNQKCSIAQAFDIEINKQGIRDLSVPSFHLSTEEEVFGYHLVEEGKKETKKDKLLVLQPFGRSSINQKGYVYDNGGRSLDIMDTIALVKKLKTHFAVVLMSEHKLSGEDWKGVGQPDNITLRQWAGIIKNADHFIGIDSVGQHLATALDVTSTVVFGSTFPINTSYPNHPKVDIVDFDAEQREYSPIRIAMDDVTERNNDRCLKFKDKYKCIDAIVKSAKKATGIK